MRTIDGHRIGRLREVRGSYLRIDAPLQRDFWLDCADVKRVDHETLVVAFDGRALDEHKIADPSPQPPPERDPLAERGARPVFSEEDERRQRERMERTLHQQSRTLDPASQHAPHEVPGAAPLDVPERERVRGETLALEQLFAFIGRALVDADGTAIGTIDEVYYDEGSLRPVWIGVDVRGLWGSRRMVVPVHGSYVFGDTISVPYAREHVLEGPAGGPPADDEQERAFASHYGLPPTP